MGRRLRGPTKCSKGEPTRSSRSIRKPASGVLHFPCAEVRFMAPVRWVDGLRAASPKTRQRRIPESAEDLGNFTPCSPGKICNLTQNTVATTRTSNVERVATALEQDRNRIFTGQESPTVRPRPGVRVGDRRDPRHEGSRAGQFRHFFTLSAAEAPSPLF